MAQLSKVLKVLCWAGSVPFPPVSLQRQVVCLTVAACVHVFIRGELTLVSWLVGVQIKVMLQQPLTCDSSSMLPTCFPQLPIPTPLQKERLFIRTQTHNLQIFGVIPFVKIQIDTFTTVKRWENDNLKNWRQLIFFGWAMLFSWQFILLDRTGQENNIAQPKKRSYFASRLIFHRF